MKNKVVVGIAGVIMIGAVVGSYMVGSEMGQVQGMNKILSEQKIANQTAHTDWADFGGGYYIIGAEAIAVGDGMTTFEFVSGTQVVSKLGEFNLDSVYMVTAYDNGTPDWMNDDVVIVVWEAK